MISKTISTIVILSMASILLAAPVAAYQTSVSVNAPESVDGDFVVTIGIENVTDLDSGQFELHFDPAAVNVTGVDDGTIGDSIIPIMEWEVDEDRIKVLFNLPGAGADGVSGSGSLATIHFETMVPGDCAMEISDGLLVDTMAESIPASWDGVESAVTKTKTEDKTEDKTPIKTEAKTPIKTEAKSATTDTADSEHKTSGFGALFTISVLAAAIVAFRREE